MGFGQTVKRDRFRGKFESLAVLASTIVVAVEGDEALVDAGAGSTAQKYLWDNEDGWVLASGSPSEPKSQTFSHISGVTATPSFVITNGSLDKLLLVTYDGETLNPSDVEVDGQEVTITVDLLPIATHSVVIYYFESLALALQAVAANPFRGQYAGNDFPSTGGRGAGGAVQMGDKWSYPAGIIGIEYGSGPEDWPPNTIAEALEDNPGQDPTKWRLY